VAICNPGSARDELVDTVAKRFETSPFGDGIEYDIYPRDLKEPYMARRRGVAYEMFELVGVTREDKVGRARQMMRNFDFFGAPVGMILTIERFMGPPQYSDLGIFLQSLMLLARERGLHTCAQEAWSTWGKTIREVVGVPDEELIFCGLALGHADPDAPINSLRTERAGLDEFARFEGF
jgi:nitroreductase